MLQPHAMHSNIQNTEKEIDIGQMLDDGRFGFLQQFIIALIAMIIIVEGIDIQLFSYALPQILHDWHMERSAFDLAATANSVGLLAGTLMSGYIADKMGRRSLLLISLFLCGLATFMVGMATNVNQLAFWRLLTGMGIGGALPVCTTLIAEFAPRRYRASVVTLSIVCLPLGGLLAGYFSDLVLDRLGWEKAFFIGGIMPLGLWLVSLIGLPESPRFLSRHPVRKAELTRLLRRLGKMVEEKSHFIDKEEHFNGGKVKFDLSILFTKGLARDTMTLWVLFFLCMVGSYAIFAWLPTMLEASGMARHEARFSLKLYNAGGIVGIILCAQTLARFGSRPSLMVCTLGALITIVPLFLLNVAESISFVLSLIALHGIFANAVQSIFYAFAAHLYMTQIRATGATIALTHGRIGGIIAIYACAHLGGFTHYLILLTCALTALFLALFFLRCHIIPVKKQKKNKAPFLKEALKAES